MTASQSDIAGNIGTGSRDTLKDGGVPVVTVTTAPAINFANRLAYSGVTGSCSENGLPVNVTMDRWGEPGTDLLERRLDGSSDQRVEPARRGRRRLCRANRRCRQRRQWHPEHHQRCHAAGGDHGHCATNQPRESGPATQGSQWQLFGKRAPVTVTIRAITASPSPNCTAGSWSATAINATSVPVGTVTVLASQTDAAGNTGNGTRDTVRTLQHRR